MSAVKGRYRNGAIILDEPANWPEDTEVRVEPIVKRDFEGMSEEEWHTDSESIARWIAEFDAIPALQMSPEEEAEWQAALKAQKDHQIANWEKKAAEIERLFP